MDKKILCLLHLPPPNYGVTILNKNILEGSIKNHFLLDIIPINTAKQQNKINRLAFKKLFYFIKIIFVLLSKLISNRYCFCYFSLTPTGIGFYKDVVFVILLKIFKIKRLYHLHGKGISLKNGFIDKFLYRLCFQNSKVIIISQSLFYDIEDYIDKQDVFVLPNATKQNLEDEEFGKIMKNRLNKTTLNLLFLSNMIKSKGVFTTLEAANILNKMNYDFKFYFVGEWSDISLEGFMNKIDEFKLKEKVEYLGFKEGAEKHRILEGADIFVYPTLKDTFPLVVLEAMEYGLPIVSTNEGAIPEIIEDELNGFIVSCKDSLGLKEKLERLINEPSLRITMGRANREKFLRMYTFELFEKRLSNIFNEVTA